MTAVRANKVEFYHSCCGTKLDSHTYSVASIFSSESDKYLNQKRHNAFTYNLHSINSVIQWHYCRPRSPRITPFNKFIVLSFLMLKYWKYIPAPFHCHRWCSLTPFPEMCLRLCLTVWQSCHRRCPHLRRHSTVLHGLIWWFRFFPPISGINIAHLYTNRKHSCTLMRVYLTAVKKIILLPLLMGCVTNNMKNKIYQFYSKPAVHKN